ncbi:MAG: DUF2007 domain-containing protein [Gammaproteobacteria bacterium]|nr:DUF2007 domain-containing protein [Gammaproteobacteria bacterium]
MKRIHRSTDFIFVGYLRSVLEDAGIPCHLRNEHLLGASGDLPPNETWPEIWVIHDADATRAQRILEPLLDRGPDAVGDRTAWQCENCGEQLEPQFTACWSCGGSETEEFLA